MFLGRNNLCGLASSEVRGIREGDNSGAGAASSEN